MTLELGFAERRVLGVLIEKGFTTPEQYPLSLNAVVVGSNQKSCRDPISTLDEETAANGLESLRKKGFTVLVRVEGSRVDRWKHRTGECLGLDAKEVALLAELLLRGPQTDGELRQRAGRMVPFGDLDEVERTLERLSSREVPLVARLGLPGRRRGVKYAHALYPAAERPSGQSAGGEYPGGEEPLSASSAEDAEPAITPATPRVRETPTAPGLTPPVRALGGSSPGCSGAQEGDGGGDAMAALERRIRALEERVEELEATFVKFLR